MPLLSIDLLANKRDGALIDRSSIPCLDGCKIGFAGLVSCARAPAVALEEICRRGQRASRRVEASAGAVAQDVLGQELGMADLTVHGAACARREDSAIDQRQSCVELLGEIGRAAAVVSESWDSRQSVLIPARSPEARLHSPYGQQRPRRYAVALLDGGEQCRIGLLECATARGDGRTAAPGEKLIERQAHAPLVTVSGDSCARIASRHQGCEGGGADAPSSRFIGELLLPRLKASRRTAALRGASFAGHPQERHQDCDGDRLELPTLGHSELLSHSLHQTKRWLAMSWRRADICQNTDVA